MRSVIKIVAGFLIGSAHLFILFILPKFLFDVLKISDNSPILPYLPNKWASLAEFHLVIFILSGIVGSLLLRTKGLFKSFVIWGLFGVLLHLPTNIAVSILEDVDSVPTVLGMIQLFLPIPLGIILVFWLDKKLQN